MAIITAEDGTETNYTYNEDKLLESVANQVGNSITLAYDEFANLAQVSLPDYLTSF